MEHTDNSNKNKRLCGTLIENRYLIQSKIA